MSKEVEKRGRKIKQLMRHNHGIGGEGTASSEQRAQNDIEIAFLKLEVKWFLLEGKIPEYFQAEYEELKTKVMKNA